MIRKLIALKKCSISRAVVPLTIYWLFKQYLYLVDLQKDNKIDEHVTGQSKPNNCEWRDNHFFSLSFLLMHLL